MNLVLSALSFFLFWSSDLQIHFVSSVDTILQGQHVSISDTLVSAGEVFELGFFRPENYSSYYIGIWFKQISVRTVVWVGNRDFPVTSSAILSVKDGGNLVISYKQVSFWLSNVTSDGSTTATLMDSGNFVLKDLNSNVVWQSFDSPSDTFLAGMKLGINKKSGAAWSLQSWKSSLDPAIGAYSLKLDVDQPDQFSIWQGSTRYWTTGPWDGEIFSSLPGMRFNNIYDYSFINNENETYLTYTPNDSNSTLRAVLDVSGQLKQMVWLESEQQWNYFMGVPQPQCEIYAFCGAFGVCDSSTSEFCECLNGFEPQSSENWQQGDRSGGCRRKTSLRCENTSISSDEDTFQTLLNVKYPREAVTQGIWTVQECQFSCMLDCSCSAYSFDDKQGCLTWNGELLNVEQLKQGNDSAQTVYLRLAASEFPSSGKKRLVLIVTPVVIFVVVFLLCCYFGCRWRRKRMPKGRNILLFDISPEAIQSELSSKKPVSSDKDRDPGLPLFSFASVAAATNNFSSGNKLGEGGFGPVFKGKLLKGMEIAVKRLSKRSKQGLEEFQNEVMLIARVQHRNLVKLLGCCLEREEKILIYEYMPNKSLDSFLFDPFKQRLLDCETWIRVIEGIAQGLLYLHQYSRLRIIHRDLKASNVLLDADMNPKISDFGMARIFGENELQVNTNRIVGTYGYMPPEYALEGLFSIKSDVYSYGVLLLEILSGQKNTGFYQTDSINLIGYVWDLWNNNRALEMMAPVFEEKLPREKMLRYIKVGLLCVQDLAADRPTMYEVLSMLTNDGVFIPSPKTPAFSSVWNPVTRSSSANQLVRYSNNGLTLSVVGGR